MYSRSGFRCGTWSHLKLADNELWQSALDDFVPVERLLEPSRRGRVLHPQPRMSRSIRAAARLLTMRHFGLGDYETAIKTSKSAAKVAKKLFTEDWISEFEPPTTEWSRNALLRQFNKQRKRDLEWFWAFFDSALVCLVAGQFELFKDIASWVDPNLKSEFMGGDDEVELSKLYVLICHDIRDQNLPNRTAIERSIDRGKSNRPKLLKSAWEAAYNRDQELFDKHFAAAIRDFGRSHNPKCLIYEAVARHHSIIWMLAHSFGLSFPEQVDERHRAMVICNDSLKDDSHRQ